MYPLPLGTDHQAELARPVEDLAELASRLPLAEIARSLVEALAEIARSPAEALAEIARSPAEA